VLAQTRAQFRDSIRRNLGKRTSIDELGITVGVVGDPASTHKFPNNLLINQKIAEAMAWVNVEAKIGHVQDISVDIALTTSTGVQSVDLRTVGALNSMDYGQLVTVKHAYFLPTGSTTPTYSLTAVDRAEQDRVSINWTGQSAGSVRQFWIEGDTLYLSPGSSEGGTLHLMAGTGMFGMETDAETILQLPTQFHYAIEAIATAFVAETQNQDTEMIQAQQSFMAKGLKGVEQIKRWKMNVNEEFQPSIIPTNTRGYYGRR
jgi:hypothetical protein